MGAVSQSPCPWRPTRAHHLSPPAPGTERALCGDSGGRRGHHPAWSRCVSTATLPEGLSAPGDCSWRVGTPRPKSQGPGHKGTRACGHGLSVTHTGTPRPPWWVPSQVSLFTCFFLPPGVPLLGQAALGGLGWLGPRVRGAKLSSWESMLECPQAPLAPALPTHSQMQSEGAEFTGTGRGGHTGSVAMFSCLNRKWIKFFPPCSQVIATAEEPWKGHASSRSHPCL